MKNMMLKYDTKLFHVKFNLLSTWIASRYY